MTQEYRVSSSHAEDIHTGASFAPGEVAVGVDPEDPHDAALIEDGRLVEVIPSEPVKASEAAEKAAAELGVDLAEVQGTGAGGGITVDDVKKAANRDNEKESQ